MTPRAVVIGFLLCLVAGSAHASNRYTRMQLDALATRVGGTFWVVPVNGQLPSFRTAPSPAATPIQPKPNQSFVILDLVGKKTDEPYYKVKFDSGNEGYLYVEDFLEQFNAMILTVDPLASEKKRLAEGRNEDKKRVAWIQAQPWSRAVKEAAIKGQVIPGMTSNAVKKILGDPVRVQRVKTPHKVTEEHWFYSDGKVLVFQNRSLNRIESTKKP